VLDVADLRVSYAGEVPALHGVSLTVGEGEAVALVGANGAGKTTLLKALAGLVEVADGGITFRGRTITRLPADERVGLGIALVPEGRRLFGRLRVRENLTLGTYTNKDPAHRAGRLGFVYSLFPILRERAEQRAGTLSGGEQQMLAMARALLVKPKLLLLDEMSQGLAPTVVQQLFQRIDLFRQQGTAVFLVEQFVDSALAVADRAYVFEQGTIAHEAPAALLRRDQTVLASSYLGTAIDVKAPVLAAAGGDGTSGRLMEDLTFKLPAEIKRALEEKADREGRRTEDLLLEVLGTSAKEAS